jgi:hypothetical protein
MTVTTLPDMKKEELLFVKRLQTRAIYANTEETFKMKGTIL